MRAILIVLLSLMLAACGGGDPEREKLDRTYDFAASVLREIGTREIAGLAFQDTIEMGGTPLNYVIANAPEKADFAKLRWQGPPEPWSVRISEGSEAGQVLLEAFAADTSAPVRSETISLQAKR